MKQKLVVGISSLVVILGIIFVILGDQQELDYGSLNISELTTLSNDGDSKAQGVLAYYYQEGIKVNKDYEKSLEWYLISAENGNTTSMVNIAYLYSNGIGVKQDHEKAFKWNLKAAENGDSSGMFNVSKKYEFGLGVEKNLKKASYWLEKSGVEI
ncbi:tetratricopeptide repeat protein [Solibacillus sp. CAU 1738]|uniref:tetratricopeptide repeat protein n=1 Tax=Solibacillus sp. CAU 1738 TaxID=3140363 RepID=UPI003260E902